MLRLRVIPALLLRDRGLIKTTRFKKPRYVGDPINAVKIFNEKEVDEIVFLDTEASKRGRRPDFKLVSEIASECFMPFAYGGGVRDIGDVKTLCSIGAEKVIINSRAVAYPEFVREASDVCGSQSVVVSIDAKRNFMGQYKVYTTGGSTATKYDPVRFARLMEEMGAGEILLTSIDHDGTMKGYDIALIRRVTDVVGIPVIASGGAGTVADFRDAQTQGGAAAVSAGSMFVFHGKHRAVLISYPTQEELRTLDTMENRNETAPIPNM